jgi:hypothetical protein
MTWRAISNGRPWFGEEAVDAKLKRQANAIQTLKSENAELTRDVEEKKKSLNHYKGKAGKGGEGDKLEADRVKVGRCRLSL